jgi:hypothetical protein
MILAAAAAWLPRSADALERALARAGDPQSEWNGGADCSIQYWNTCVGWTWTWTGWSPFDRIGVNYTSCAGGFLVGVDIFTRFTNGVPVLPGYGFSPTLLVYTADEGGCPTGPVLGSRLFLPNGTTQSLNFAAPVAVPASFVTVVQMASGGGGTTRYGTDYDVQGPTGPQGCGTCFPTTRVSNSYYYGKPQSPLCPGSQFSTVCPVELLWTARMVVPIGVEETSWGSIKGLYR